MVNDRLIINGVSVPLESSIATEIIYSIQDIENPDKRKAAYTKAFKLPASKELNKVFNFIFEVNIDCTFNPNVKADAIYLIKDVSIFSGYIQLLDIIKEDNSKISYEIMLIGELANIFVELGSEDIDDVNMSWTNLDHAFDFPEFINTWDTEYFLNGFATPFVLGSGYIYCPAIYGGTPETSVYDAYPGVFLREIIVRLFSAAGFTFTSTFFDSTFFKSLVIPYSGKEFSKGYTNNEGLLAELDTPSFKTAASDTITTTTALTVAFGDTLLFSNVVTDPSLQYNVATGVFTASQSGVYEVTIELDFQYTFNSGAANNADMINEFNTNLIISKNGSPYDSLNTWSIEATAIPPAGYTSSLVSVYPDENFLVPADGLQGPNGYNTSYDYNYSQSPYKYRLTVIVPLEAADTFDVTINGSYNSIDGYDTQSRVVNRLENFYDTTALTYSSGSCSLKLNAGSIRVENNYFNEWAGETIEMKSAIPKNIKKKDLLKSVIEAFNLYIEPDADNPRNLIVETHNDYFTADVEDISELQDFSKIVKYKTLASYNKNSYLYTYKPDKDYYNELYSQNWGHTYGRQEIYTNNDFSKEQHKTELIFSPTPSLGGFSHNRVMPVIAKGDSTTGLTATTANIRLWYYGGLLDSSTPFKIRQGTTGGESAFLSQYPYFGHLDHPRNPTVDINFGSVREVYYTSSFGALSWTDNNLFYKFHYDEFNQVTDKDAKLCEAYFNFNEAFMNNLSFRKQYYFEGAYFRLYEIAYNPNGNESSKCLFLKLPAKDAFVASTGTVIGGSFDGNVGTEFLPSYLPQQNIAGNISRVGTAKIEGSNNYINETSKKVIIYGDSNRVDSNCTNISITSGNNNKVSAGSTNVTLINTSGVTVSDSNTTYLNGQLISGPGSIITKDAGNTLFVDFSVRGYNVSVAFVTVTVSMPDAALHEGKYVTFKKIGDYGTVQLVPAGTQTIDGYATYTLNKNNSMISVYSDGKNYFIAL